MTRPADIPQDIWDAAENALDLMLCNDVQASGTSQQFRIDSIEPHARAILAERERCATEAILVGSRVELRMAVDAPLGKAALARLHLVQETCEAIKAAIRKGSA